MYCCHNSPCGSGPHAVTPDERGPHPVADVGRVWVVVVEGVAAPVDRLPGPPGASRQHLGEHGREKDRGQDQQQDDQQDQSAGVEVKG